MIFRLALYLSMLERMKLAHAIERMMASHQGRIQLKGIKMANAHATAMRVILSEGLSLATLRIKSATAMFEHATDCRRRFACRSRLRRLLLSLCCVGRFLL